MGAERSLTPLHGVGIVSPSSTFGETEAQRGKIICQGYMAHAEAEDHRGNPGCLTSGLLVSAHPTVIEVLQANAFIGSRSLQSHRFNSHSVLVPKTLFLTHLLAE